MNTKEFQASFQFIGSKISKFKQNNDFLSMTIDMDLNRSIDVEYSTNSIEERENRFYGVLTLYVKVDVKEKGRDKNKKKYHGELEIVGFFGADKGLGKEDFSKMLEINGCASFIAVARAFFTSITALSMLDGHIVLPLLNIVNMSKKKDETK